MCTNERVAGLLVEHAPTNPGRSLQHGALYAAGLRWKRLAEIYRPARAPLHQTTSSNGFALVQLLLERHSAKVKCAAGQDGRRFQKLTPHTASEGTLGNGATMAAQCSALQEAGDYRSCRACSMPVLPTLRHNIRSKRSYDRSSGFSGEVSVLFHKDSGHLMTTNDLIRQVCVSPNEERLHVDHECGGTTRPADGAPFRRRTETRV